MKISLANFASLVERAAQKVRPRLEAVVTRTGVEIQAEAQLLIGQELPEWAPLKPSTIATKERLGYTGHVSATDPRLRTGADRQSIHSVPAGLEVAVGSNSQKFVYQELGTSRIPPRPVFAIATTKSLPFAEKQLGKIAATLLSKRYIED